jgi:maltose O-acetyltransferase
MPERFAAQWRIRQVGASYLGASLGALLLRGTRVMDLLLEAQERRQLQQIATISEQATIDRQARITNYTGERAAIRIGPYTHIHGWLRTLNAGGSICLGTGCFVGAGSRIWAQSSVSIGNHVLIAHLVDVHDTNSHPTGALARRRDFQQMVAGDPKDTSCVAAAPIVIEDDVWVGFKSSILKGVHVGRGAIIAAGSMVTKDVPAWTIVAGNPATIIRTLSPNERDCS